MWRATHESFLVSPFARDLLATLPARRIGSRWFYDRRGSELFEAITELPEYYPTRTETALLRAHAGEMAAFLGPDATVVEYGAGALNKVRILLGALERPRRFKPIDVSGEFVKHASARLRTNFPALPVEPIVASFTDRFDFGLDRGLDGSLDGGLASDPNPVGFFPGSTVGNLEDGEIVALLRHARALDRFLLGVDLVKDPQIMVAAYDDSRGVTAEFNLNLLARANREADADFDPRAWRHVALWNGESSRMEMHLESRSAQTVEVAGQPFRFEEGERIHTEISRKFTPERLAPLLAEGGWELERPWIDSATPYAILGLIRSAKPASAKPASAKPASAKPASEGSA